MGLTYYNCAQRVLIAFATKYNINPNLISEFRKYGAGRTPNIECGALFAAKYLLKDNQHFCKHVENKFQKRAGATECKTIRALNKISCQQCVEVVIDLLHKCSKEK